jgi:hypothetical protein
MITMGLPVPVQAAKQSTCKARRRVCEDDLDFTWNAILQSATLVQRTPHDRITKILRGTEAADLNIR